LNPKATKEFVLNYTMNRWQLNFKKNVGPTSDSIRQCSPNSIDEWEEYYYANVRPREHIIELGRRLFQLIQEVISQEERFHPELLASIREEDCIAYMHNIVIQRTYEGYIKERNR
jgi:hypothetical protein